MFSFFGQMGIWLYPLLLASALLLIQIGLAAKGVGRGDSGRRSRSTNAILAWGALNGVLGILGTVIGFFLAAATIEGASAVSFNLIWGGVRVALSTSVFGLLMLALSLVAWLVIRFLDGRGSAPA